jgi:Uma2 family endonuclease
MTLAEFLDWDDGTDRRYELIDGVPVAMAPALPRHGRLKNRLGAFFEARLTPPCAAYPEAGIRLPHKADSYYVADLAVICDPVDLDRPYETDPQVIVEILSPTTEREDRQIKLPDYLQIPAAREIVLVHSERREVVLWARSNRDWQRHGVQGQGTLPLASLGLELDLATIYDGIVD